MSSLELRSKVVPEYRLELLLERVEIADPGPCEVVVRVEAAPINPTDLGMLEPEMEGVLASSWMTLFGGLTDARERAHSRCRAKATVNI